MIIGVGRVLPRYLKNRGEWTELEGPVTMRVLENEGSLYMGEPFTVSDKELSSLKKVFPFRYGSSEPFDLTIEATYIADEGELLEGTLSFYVNGKSRAQAYFDMDAFALRVDTASLDYKPVIEFWVNHVGSQVKALTEYAKSEM